jgi:hypothetical protein
MEALAVPLMLAVILAFVGYRQWLRHHPRVLIHRERLTALEKGMDLPAWPEPPRSIISVRDVLLLSGLIWLAVGIGGMIAAFAIIPTAQVQNLPEAPPATVALIGLPVALIGVAHLIVYVRLGRRE